jgi:phage terminase large subunit
VTAVESQEIVAQFPEKALFLAEPHPYKILYGGRDGTKSWCAAQQLILNGAERKIRWLCARETQKSMADSVHKLLGDTIERLGLQRRYTVKESEIVGSNGTEILFAGIKNAKNIKSYESCDGVWVEEAQVVSKASWEILLPTIRKSGSEIWVTFNPELDTDDTYVRWVLKPPPGAKVVKIGYEDNPWISDISRARIAHLRRTDPIAFDHIYGGNCKSSVEGAIFAGEIAKAVEEGRIASVPYNRTKPVDTVWDLGFSDLTTVWFVQSYGGYYNFIDYLQGDGLTISDYVVKLQNRGYMYGVDWLPHDAVDTIIHRRLAGGDRTMSIEMLMRAAGRNVRMVPKMLITDGINAARTVFPQCRFDASKCADGLQALRHYQWAPVKERGAAAPESLSHLANRGPEPLHNWASHAADAFRGAAVALKQPDQEWEQPSPNPNRYRGPDAWQL